MKNSTRRATSLALIASLLTPTTLFAQLEKLKAAADSALPGTIAGLRERLAQEKKRQRVEKLNGLVETMAAQGLNADEAWVASGVALSVKDPANAIEDELVGRLEDHVDLMNEMLEAGDKAMAAADEANAMLRQDGKAICGTATQQQKLAILEKAINDTGTADALRTRRPDDALGLIALYKGAFKTGWLTGSFTPMEECLRQQAGMGGSAQQRAQARAAILAKAKVDEQARIEARTAERERRIVEERRRAEAERQDAIRRAEEERRAAERERQEAIDRARWEREQYDADLRAELDRRWRDDWNNGRWERNRWDTWERGYVNDWHRERERQEAARRAREEQDRLDRYRRERENNERANRERQERENNDRANRERQDRERQDRERQDRERQERERQKPREEPKHEEPRHEEPKHDNGGGGGGGGSHESDADRLERYRRERGGH